MKYIAVSIVSALLGALIALLFAPSSGAELRGNIKSEVETQVAKARDELNKGVQEVQGRVDKLSAELKARLSQPDELEPPAGTAA
jgi:gas vesicle protein